MGRLSKMICIDILLFVGFVLVFSPRMTGLALHEITGLVLFLPAVLHLLFSWPWITKSFRPLWNRAGWNKWFNYLLNVGLFLLFAIELVSGIAISHSVLPYFGIETINDRVWRSVHNLVSDGIVVAITLHIALNWPRIKSYFIKFMPGGRKKTKNRKPILLSQLMKRGLLRTFMICLAVTIIGAIVYLALGAPNKNRINTENDMLRLQQNIIPGGVAQVTGVIIVMIILVYMAHRYLKLKL
jgi:predicted PurR-regulated permease PerM